MSIAGTGMSVNGGVDLMTASCNSISNNPHQSNSNSSNKLQKERPPLPKQANASPASNNKRAPLSSSSQLTSASSRDSLMSRSMDLGKRPATTPKKTAKGATPLQSPGQEQKPIVAKQKSVERIAPVVVKKETTVTTVDPQTTVTTTTTEVTTTVTSAAGDVVNEAVTESVEVIEQKMEQLEVTGTEEEDHSEKTVVEVSQPTTNNVNDMFIAAERANVAIIPDEQKKIAKEIQNLEKQQESLNETTDTLQPSSIEEAVDMTASMIAKSKITTEEEAKAALAERRRLARVEAERQAELERQKAEAAEEAERARLMEEEEKYRQMEVEANRLAQEARRAEEERLAQAIEEAQKKEEEERVKREEDARLKQEQLEQEKKAREEAEKQRLEMAEKLKKEEKEREERRKRVEAIMSRTRAKGSAPNTPVKSGEEEKSDGTQKEEVANNKDIPQEAAQPTTANGNDNNNHESGFQANNKEGTNGGVLGLKNGQQDSYEKTVTDKENALLGSFDNHIISEEVTQTAVEANNNILTTQETQVLSVAPGENGFHKNGIDNSL